MISTNLNSPYVSFKAEPKAIGGAAFQPKNEVLLMEDAHAPTCEVLKLNPLQKFKLGVKKVTVDIPGSIVRGLQGDKSVSFHEFLQMAAVPYYLGGAMLFNSFRAGGDIKLAKKQGVGVGLYYLGMGLGNNFINSFVKHKYGVDLDMKYKNDQGEIHKVFESLDFTRWDLLTDDDWNRIGDKLGIPQDVVDRDTAVKAEVQKILVKARAWKLVLGALFAATGAGFIARNKGWENLFQSLGKQGAVRTSFNALMNKNNTKPLMKRLGELKTSVAGAFKSEIVKPFVNAFKELPAKKLGSVPVGKLAIGALIALPIMALVSLIRTPNKDKIYLSKSEAMPFSTKIQNDPALRDQIASKINPNKVDYEQLYTQIATSQLNSPAAIQTRQAQIDPHSPFAVFEAFMRGV
jgi:hypothetical protein